MSARPGDWVARLELDPTAFIAPGAVVVGTVRLGPRASVWFNSVVRGDTDRVEIGEASNVQDNSTVHIDAGLPALIGARVTIGHRAVIHGCVIEDDCLIGMGSVVLSGARIGSGSLIGAGSVVREGQVIPPGSLALGAPARVLGPVNDRHRDAIREGSWHYAELARSYMERGFARPHPPRDSDTGVSARNPGVLTTALEWDALVDRLASAPGEVRRLGSGLADSDWRRAPGPDRWSALDIVCHLRNCDREVFHPRFEMLLRESFPVLPDVPMGHRAAGDTDRARGAGDLLDEWGQTRAVLVRGLVALTPAQWARTGIHAVRGSYSVADMVRACASHDRAHLRQIAAALRPS